MGRAAKKQEQGRRAERRPDQPVKAGAEKKGALSTKTPLGQAAYTQPVNGEQAAILGS